MGEVWIGLKQNIIGTAVNKTRYHLCVCGHVICWHSKTFLLQTVAKRTIKWNAK